MAIQALSPDDVYKYLHTSPSGLEGHEAAERLKHFGPNDITETARKPLLYTLIKHITNLFALLLWGATIIAFIGEAVKTGEGFMILGFAIIGVIFLNGGFAFFQEYRAEKAFEELKKLLPFRVTVIRDGKEAEEMASHIVPGDLVLLKEGDRVPADIRLIESAELKVDVSSLTGESIPVKRTFYPQNNIELIDSLNLVFAGTSVVTGQGRGVVFATGMSTEFGKITRLTSEVKSGMSPLELETMRVTRTISIIAVLLGVLFFVTGIFIGRNFTENFIFALGIVVGMVPEGLMPTVTLSLALASQRMAKKKAIVRKLTSIETLGAVTVICTDKTGTLTQNKMSVVEVYTNGQSLLTQDFPPLFKGRRGGVFSDEPLMCRELKKAHENGSILRQAQDDNQGVMVSLSNHDWQSVALSHKLFLKAITLCNDAHTRDGVIIGDPTEKALLEYAQNYLDIDALKSEEPRISEHPFDSIKKWMATIHQPVMSGAITKDDENGTPSPIHSSTRGEGDINLLPSPLRGEGQGGGEQRPLSEKTTGTKIIYVKGAPETVMPLCKNVLIDNEVIPFDESKKREAEQALRDMTVKALRVLSVAYATFPPPLNSNTQEEEALEDSSVDSLCSPPPLPSPLKGEGVGFIPPPQIHMAVMKKNATNIPSPLRGEGQGGGEHSLPDITNLTFLGLIALEDPPRPEVPDAIKGCKSAGIKIIMVTGDNPDTARAVGREIGLFNAPVVITGHDLKRLTHKELMQVLKGKEIAFARVTPEDKMTIVSALKDIGEVVAVTGDGVNDAPALKKADIGVAMGLSGTDVAKEASDIILMDDNFATIVKAIEEGRTVFENIKKFTTYVLTHTIPEIIPFIGYVLFNIPLPLTIFQILAIDLGTDIIPALALGAEPPEPDILNRPPRSMKERLLSFPLLARAYLFLGPIEALASMAGFFWFLSISGWTWGTNLTSTDPVYLKATTVCLTGIIMTQIANVLVCRSRINSVFSLPLKSNKLILYGILTEIILLLLIVYTNGGNIIAGTSPLPIYAWLFFIPFSLFLLAMEELRKFIVRSI